MHDTNLDYFFLIHFLACYLEAFFGPQSNECFKGKLTFVIFESFFSACPLILLFGHHLNGQWSGGRVWKDFILTYKAEFMFMGKHKSSDARFSIPKIVAQGIAPDKALPAERDTAAVFPVVLHCLEFLHNDYSQEPLRYLSLVTQKGEEKKSWED